MTGTITEYCVMCNKELPNYKPEVCHGAILPPVCSQKCWTALCKMENCEIDEAHHEQKG